MKYFFLFVIAGSLYACTGTDRQSSVEKATKDSLNEVALKDSSKYTTIEWLDSTDQNIGKVEAGQVVEITWHFRNAGTKPLVVANVRAGCGCTGAEGPQEPIAPGKEGVIKAKFDSHNFSGVQRKEVYVRANNSNRNNTDQDVLRFEVDVTKK
jgi:hypothetical protein